MDITIFDLEGTDGLVVTWVKIDRGNDEFTWMPKAIWDKLEAQREQSGTL